MVKVIIKYLLLLALSSEAQKLTKNECYILTLIPFSDRRPGPSDEISQAGVEYYGQGTWPSAISLGKAAFSQMAAAQMAKHHFNNRNPEVVPQLAEEVYQACSVRIGSDAWYKDSQYDLRASLEALLDIDSVASLSQGPEVCGVIGPVHSRAVDGVSALTDSQGVPQVTTAVNERLSNRINFPSIVRSKPDISYFAKSIADYLQRPGLEREAIGIIADADEYGEQFEDPLEDYGEDELGMETTSEFLQQTTESVQKALSEVKRKGFHTIVLITDRPVFLNLVADMAVNMSLVGPEWLWLISGETLPPQLLETFENIPDSPLDLLLRGAGIFADFDPFLIAPDQDRFLQSWKAQNSAIIAEISKQHPLNTSQPEYFQGGPTFFSDSNPSPYSSFIYDSVMLIGMAACQLEAKINNGNHVPEDDVGGVHLGEMLLTEFDGASGKVRFVREDGETTNSRDPNGTIFAMFNVRAVPGSNGKNRYSSVPTAIYKDGQWDDVENEQFLFFDNTTNQPTPLITTFDYHYIENNVRISGMFLMVLSLVISVGSFFWVYIHRDVDLIQLAQPKFLYLLCFGSMLLGSSLSFVSFDEDQGYEEGELSKLCAAFPWLSVLGYLVIYCALFSKLWRVKKLLQMSRGERRLQVSFIQSLWPFAIILASSIVVLLCWQIVDPLRWQRVIVQSEPLESMGKCTSDNATPYIASLGVLIASITLMTLHISFVTKNVKEELSEGRWILYGILIHAQTWIVGIPVYIILNNDSATTAYLIQSLLIFTFSASMVVIIIWPKVFTYTRKTYSGYIESKAKANISNNQSENSRLAEDMQSNVSEPPTHIDNLNSLDAEMNSSKIYDARVSFVKKQDFGNDTNASVQGFIDEN